MLDPKGYYALLGVGPEAPSTAIHAAFRRKAKLLHPDVPVTGDAGAFMRVKEAYEVISDVLRRNEYDRLARAETLKGSLRAGARVGSAPAWSSFDYESPTPDLEASYPPEPPPPEPFVMPVRPSVLAWGGVGLVVTAGIVGAIWQLTRPPPVVHPANLTAMPYANLPDEPPAEPPGAPARSGPGSPYYIQPVAGTAMLWRYDDADRHYRPQGRIAAFTPVALLRLVSHGALAEIQLASGQIGYVYPHLLAPGDAAAAERAACIYNAGETPQNGEILPPPAEAPGAPVSLASSGGAATTIDNRSDIPLVVALRHGVQFIAVYVTPHAQARLSGLPAGAWQIDWATGDLWSRSCFRFMAGMRGQRIREAALPAVLSLPTDNAIDIADDAFGH
jgi:hypothetical protein